MQVLDSAAEVAQQSDITIGMLADPAAALDVALGEKGVAAGLSSGSRSLVYVVMTGSLESLRSFWMAAFGLSAASSALSVSED